MEFVRNFPASYSWTDISKTVRSLVEECDARVSIEAIGKTTTVRIEVDAEDLRGFLHCAGRYIDDHTLSSWEHQVEVAEARSEIQHEYGRATGKKIEEKWVKVRKGIITNIKKPSKKEIERLLDEGYTVTRHTEYLQEDGVTKTELFSYSPLTRAEAVKHEMNVLTAAAGRGSVDEE